MLFFVLRLTTQTHPLTHAHTHTHIHTYTHLGDLRVDPNSIPWWGWGGCRGECVYCLLPSPGLTRGSGCMLSPHTHTHTHTHIFIYIHIYIYIYIYIYMYIYVCIYIYMYISKYIYYLYVFIFNSINQFGRRWSLRRVLWTSATTRPLMWFSVLRLTHTYTHGWTFGFQANWFIKVPTVASGPSRRSAAGLRRRRTRRTS